MGDFSSPSAKRELRVLIGILAIGVSMVAIIFAAGLFAVFSVIREVAPSPSPSSRYSDIAVFQMLGVRTETNAGRFPADGSDN